MCPHYLLKAKISQEHPDLPKFVPLVTGGYGFPQVGVQVGSKNPRVTHANP